MKKRKFLILASIFFVIAALFTLYRFGHLKIFADQKEQIILFKVVDKENKPVKNALVDFSDKSGSSLFRAYSDSTGIARLSVLWPDQAVEGQIFRSLATKSGCSTEPIAIIYPLTDNSTRSLVFSKCDPPADDGCADDTICQSGYKCNLDTKQCEKKLQASEGYFSLYGTVADENGNPINDVNIRVESSTLLQTKSQGTWLDDSWTKDPQANYKIENIKYSGAASLKVTFWTGEGKQLQKEINVSEIKDGKYRLDSISQCKKGIKISGKITESKSNTPINAFVNFTINGKPADTINGTQTDSEGLYSFYLKNDGDLLSNQYIVKIEASYSPFNVKEAKAKALYINPDKRFTGGQLQIERCKEYNNINLVIDPESALDSNHVYIEGGVFDRTTLKPIQGAYVDIAQNGKFLEFAPVKTNELGKYFLYVKLPGDASLQSYQLRAFHHNYSDDSSAVINIQMSNGRKYTPKITNFILNKCNQ